MNEEISQIQKSSNSDIGMGLVKALEKLEDSRFQRFTKKLSVCKVRKGYKNIPKDELVGKDPEQVAGLITQHYGDAYGAEVTLTILKDISEKNIRKELQSDLRKAEGLSIDKHQQYLIKRMKVVHPVIIDLYMKGLLTVEERDVILGMSDPEDMMRRLYDNVRHWRLYDKQKAFEILKRYNPSVFDVPKTGAESENSLLDNPEMEEEDVRCKLCDKYQLYQDPVEVTTPAIIGSTYCLSMDSPGLFRCSETGIQFQVTQPVTIDYEVDSWSNYTEVLQTLHGGCEVIGPLFNIKSSAEPGVISAVYLPHCLCLAGFTGDSSVIRCFHYKDDNMVLETPSRTEVTYAVLENPTFSLLGVITYPFNLFKPSPQHGMALLFCNTISRKDLTHRFILHLYLLPKICTVRKNVELYERSFSFQKIPKPPQTQSVYYNKNYRIIGPPTARVTPRKLLFESFHPSEIYSYTEISMEGKETTEAQVSVLPEDEEVTVWETVVTAEEMLNLPSAESRPGDHKPLPEHFLDEHFADLVRTISLVEPVLDDLHTLKLLNNEQYDIVLSQSTNPEKMRKLYAYIRAFSDNDKDKVLQSLRQHNRPIIKKLETRAPADLHESQALSITPKCLIL